ncbi:MAG: type II toxin-antitoxin system VapC family toxin [Bryobacteraceae bacterium]
MAAILLDTHCWVRLQSGNTRQLDRSTERAIQRASQRGELFVSVISVWEVGLLESKGRLRLGLPCERWIQEALKTPGLTLAPLTPEIAVASTRLPGSFHPDPADRIIVATALDLGAKLATSDEAIIEYAKGQRLGIA